MKNTMKLMLGAVILAGAFGIAAPKANAAQFGVYVRGPVAYVPPSPGPGYFWTAGFYDGGYWVPGRWEFRGDGFRDRDRFEVRDYDRFHGRDFDRDRDRGWDRDRDRDHDRFRR
jgi:hypothetical protein